MNILYLLKTLKTNKLSEVVACIDLPPLDMNLAIWEAIDRGEIEVNEDKDRITALKDAVPSGDLVLREKLFKTIEHYIANETNVTRGRLAGLIKDPMTGQGYATHEYLMALQYLVDEGLVLEDIMEVPKTKKRPFHKFVFLCLPGKPNEEWNAKAVNKWIADFDKNK